jgi:hypothetical protein
MTPPEAESTHQLLHPQKAPDDFATHDLQCGDAKKSTLVRLVPSIHRKLALPEKRLVTNNRVLRRAGACASASQRVVAARQFVVSDFAQVISDEDIWNA